MTYYQRGYNDPPQDRSTDHRDAASQWGPLTQTGEAGRWGHRPSNSEMWSWTGGLIVVARVTAAVFFSMAHSDTQTAFNNLMPSKVSSETTGSR